MPTLQVTQSTGELLQNVADTIGKARKVVVITGAGISTNSGIPDFRSQNGLYSLIQTQYDKAQAASLNQQDDDEFEASDRPSKRRKLSSAAESLVDDFEQDRVSEVADCISVSCESDTVLELPALPELPSQPARSEAGEDDLDRPIDSSIRQNTPKRMTRSQRLARPDFPRIDTDGSLLSNPGLSTASSQTDEQTLPTDDEEDVIHAMPYRTPKKSQLAAMFSSSPLSSPPAILWDPYENALPSTDASSQIVSDSSDDSDADNEDHAVNLFSGSHGNTSKLRTMKGRDLFDVNVWADPVKTSVFYRFATSLRQKVKEIEPTDTHRFIAQLRDVGKLARVYTQNIDEIEKKLGLSTDLKHGAGSKRRRSGKIIRQQPQPEDAENADAIQTLQESQSSSQNTTKDSSEDSKQWRTTPPPEKGVECVFLHGSLSSLRCFLCGKVADWDEDGREGCTLSGEQPECPHCAEAAQARVDKGRRALGVGKLRPDIVLYGEEHPQSDLISPIVQHDLSAGPDVLLIMGTSLRVHGLKIMVREFAKSVHAKGGKVIFINFTQPSESVWGDILDYWIQWDCDAWVNDLKERKPHLWLSAEEVQEQDRQKREERAEKKRESILRREGTMEKKRESLNANSQHMLEAPKEPAKNPQCMRNDMSCGAYVTWDIMQSLAKVGGRPFDHLATTVEVVPQLLEALPEVTPQNEETLVEIVPCIKETPVPLPTIPDFIVRAQTESSATATTTPKSARKRATKPKKSRKSAPAAFAVVSESTLNMEAAESKPQPAASSFSMFKAAAGRLPRASDADHSARLQVLSRPATPTPPPVEESIPEELSASIGAAIKRNPRQRKPKVFFDQGPIKETKPAGKRTLPPPTPILEAARSQHRHSLPSVHFDSHLPPINTHTGPPARFLEVKMQLSPLQHPKRNVRPAPYVIPESKFPPMRFSDPLGKLGYYANFPERPRNDPLEQTSRPLARHDSLQEASDQLLREEEAAKTLACMQEFHSH